MESITVKARKLLTGVILSAIFFHSSYSLSAQQKVQEEKERLQQRVDSLLENDNISVRSGVDDIFELAQIYEKEGNFQKATYLYREALKVDSWRLEYQLRFARLLSRQGNKRQAMEKAKIVNEYAEDESLIAASEALLTEFGIKKDISDQTTWENGNTCEIVLVPVGNVNMRLLRELKEELQTRVQIKYTVLEEKIDPGKPDRDPAEEYVTAATGRMLSIASDTMTSGILSELGMDNSDLETYEGKKAFLTGLFKKRNMPQNGIEEFLKRLSAMEKRRQFRTSRIISKLRGNYPLAQDSLVKGYLAVTEKDLFMKEHNFVFGSAGKGYGIMSYNRFTAAYADRPPNRPKLRERACKQMISSTFFILGIPRCTTPVCARAYPNSLAEHDLKSDEICSWCRERLDNYINRTCK